MNRVSILASLVICFGLISGATASAKSSDDDVASCLQMIRDMVGVEPSPVVTEYCEKGDRDGAMKAAMAGE